MLPNKRARHMLIYVRICVSKKFMLEYRQTVLSFPKRLRLVDYRCLKWRQWQGNRNINS